MVQTLMTLMALMTAMLFIFNQQRHAMHAEMTMLRNEVMAQATTVAVDRLEEIGALAFDERTKGEVSLASTNDLTNAATFTADAPPIDDIDDFDGASVLQFRVAWHDTLWFRVETDVAYAQEANPGQAVVGTTRTKFKKATVRVVSLSLALSDTIQLAQSFACGSKCNW
jgi:hypothetical protein